MWSCWNKTVEEDVRVYEDDAIDRCAQSHPIFERREPGC